MARSWFGDLTLVDFQRTHYRRAPLACQGGAAQAIGACDWHSLGALLAARPAPDTLVISRGVVTGDPVPSSLAQLRALFARSVGIVVRDAERQCARLAALARRFGQDLPGRLRVLVFATPAGTHGFSWHYDAEDVFILQTAGEKVYYFRENTVDPCPRLGAQPDFSSFARERTPLMSCSLGRGDLLYLPRGYWHVAQPRADSLSISIGVY